MKTILILCAILSLLSSSLAVIADLGCQWSAHSMYQSFPGGDMNRYLKPEHIIYDEVYNGNTMAYHYLCLDDESYIYNSGVCEGDDWCHEHSALGTGYSHEMEYPYPAYYVWYEWDVPNVTFLQPMYEKHCQYVIHIGGQNGAYECSPDVTIYRRLEGEDLDANEKRMLTETEKYKKRILIYTNKVAKLEAIPDDKRTKLQKEHLAKHQKVIDTANERLGNVTRRLSEITEERRRLRFLAEETK